MKKSMIRLLSLMLCLITLLQILPMGAAAASVIEIDSFSDLKKAAKKTYSTSTTVSYNGHDELIISESLKLPANLSLEVPNAQLTIAKGVTFRISERLDAEALVVKGTAYIGYSHIRDLVNVSGKLYTSNSIRLVNGATAQVTGADKIVFSNEWSVLEFWTWIEDMSDLITVVNKAKAATNPRYLYMPVFPADESFVINKSLNLPGNCHPTAFAATSVTVESGCTLTLNGSYYGYNPLNVKGKLVNKGRIYLSESGSLNIKSGGSYSGKGTIEVHNGLSVTKVVKGLDLDDFIKVKYNDVTVLFYAEPIVLKESNVASSGKPKISWNGVDYAEEYQVYRKTSKTGDYKKVKTTTSKSYTDKDTTPGKTYYYKVRAVTADGGKSAYSKEISRSCDLARPEVKGTNVSSSGKPKLSWDKISGAEKYYVYRATSENGDYEKIKSTTSTSYTDSSAKAGKKYYYKVKAIHAKESANSAYSEPLAKYSDLSRPNVSIKLSSGDPKLSWGKISGAEKYYVYRATSKSGDYKKIKTTTSTSFTDKDVKAGKTYYYKVKAIHSKSSANSAYSSVDYIKAK